jgi:uncharacterized RDD family membrane protein YckC
VNLPTAAPDPGWYPDAADPAVERWWDGSAWSPVTRPRQDPARPPVPAENPLLAEPSRNPYAAPPPGERGDGPEPWPPGPTQGRPELPPGLPWGMPPVPGPVRPAGPATPDGVPLAPAGLRLVARVIDAVVTGLLTAAAGAYFLAELFRVLRPQFEAIAQGQAGTDMSTLLNDPAVTPLMLRYQFVGLLVGGVYSIVMTRLWGGTLGKLMVGIRVRSWDGPGLPGWTQALSRWLTREAVSQIPFAGLGSLYWIVDSVWLLWDPRRQCLHDKLPGTVVVRHRYQPQPPL